MTIREIVIAAGYTVDSNSAKAVEKSITSIKSFATKALGAIGIGFSFVKLNTLLEEYALIEQKIKNATAGLKDQADAQDIVQQAAEKCRTSYSDMVTTVTGLLNSHNRLFESVQDTTQFAELMHKAFRSAGLSAKDTATLASSMTSAFSTGKVSASQFSSLMQKTPQIITYLSQTLGISEQQVKALGTAGKITSNQLYKALTENADAINKSFGSVPLTISDAITSIKSQFSEWIYQLNEQYQITDKVARLMLNVFTRIRTFLDKCTQGVSELSEKVGGMGNLLESVGIGAVSIFGGFKLGSLAASGGLKTLISTIGKFAAGLGKASPWILLIIALIAATLIAVEDLVNFFQGNDSVVGGLFEKMGVSAEDLKEKVSNIVNSVKSVLGNLIKIIVQLLGLGAQVIGGGLAAAINVVISVLDKLMPMLQNIIDKIMPVLMKIIETLSVVLNDVMGEIMEILAVVLDVVMSLLDSLWVAIEPIIDLVVMILELVSPLLNLIKPIIQILLTLIKAILVPIAEILKLVFNLLGSVISVLVNLLNAILRPIIDILVGVMEAITPIFDMLLQLLDGVLNPIMTILKALFEPLNVIIDTLRELINGILAPITEILSLLAEILTGVLGGAIQFILKLLQPVIDIFTAIFDVVAKVISYITGAFSRAVSKIGNAITKLIKGPLGSIITVLKNVMSFISGIFTGDWSKAWKALGNIPIAIINGVISGFESLLNFFVDAINAITGALSSLWTWIGIPAIPEIPQVQFGRIAYLAQGGYVEKDSPTPVVIGDNKNEGEIVSPISKMRETVLDALATFMSSRNSTARAAQVLSQETNNRSIVQNVTIQNDFKCGSTDVGQTARKAMSKTTGDTTAELAHALAYAR